MLSAIASPLISSPSEMCLTDKCLFVSCGNHTILKISHIDTNVAVKHYSGKANEPGNEDGVLSSARFHSPQGIASMGSTLLICDSGNRSIRLVTNADPLSSFVYPYAQVFDIEHFRGAARFSFREAMSILDKLVEFLMAWGEQTRQRTSRTSTQGPNYVLWNATRRSIEVMHGSLTRLENFLSEMGAEDLLTQIRLSALVTLMVENMFSLMRQGDPMPTQLEYVIRRTACVQELEKRMYIGHFHYFTGPKSYYPDKVMNSFPPPKPAISLIEDGMEKLTLDDGKELKEFAVSLGKSVRQHNVRDKSKEDTGHLPYPVSFSLQQRETGSNVLTSTLLEGQSDTQQMDQEDLLRRQTVLQCDILFKVEEIVAVKHGRRREQWGFYLALFLKDLLIKYKTANELQFTKDVMDIMWLDNGETGDMFLLREAYEDHSNSPYSIVDRVRVNVSSDDKGLKCCQFPQEEVDRIERLLKGGIDSDIEFDDESVGKEAHSEDEIDDHPRRVSCNTK